ncbi:glycoside hydrolase family 78 protein [Lachnospiraceae bacterium OttesenSCG-928-D06]|nr:glycoside hydrolase family 78 protein [Lachnospiraceae bacterium OttesenSCG-928-D06]
MNKSFEIVNFRVENQKNPLGIHIAKPRFSWEMDAKVQDSVQRAYRIWVTKEDTETVCWDSKEQKTSQSNEILYDGITLEPCTRYFVRTKVYDNNGEKQEAETWFETGLLDTSINAWDGGKWIGQEEYSLDAKRRGVFVLEAELKIEKDCCKAGVVFGACDQRLMDKTLNEYFCEGENYICYEIDVEKTPAMLYIYRVGYHKEDKKDIPFASVPIVSLDTKELLITEDNKYDFHILTIEVTGNCAYARIDGVLVDGLYVDRWGEQVCVPRQLNPRGDNDVITYPRLNQIGFYAGPFASVLFRKLEIRNLRAPGAVILRETGEGNLYGGKSLFAEHIESQRISIQNGSFRLSGGEKGKQVLVDPSYGALPMLRRTFEVKKDRKIKKARVYATARGIYECRLNGKVISEDLFPPGNTQFDKHLLYQIYDITDILSEEENIIGFTLASGWWSDAQTFALKGYNYFGDKESLLAKVVIWYEDNTKDVIVTDTEHWEYTTDGPFTYAGFFSGESYDARKAFVTQTYTMRNGKGAENISWKQAVEVIPHKISAYSTMPAGFGREWPAVNEREPELTCDYQAAVKEVLKKQAVTREEIYPGVYIYDFGQEMAGMPLIRLREKAGTTVILRFAEMKYPPLAEYGELAGSLLFENYRDASSTDYYICAGDNKDGEVYSPRFTFHGYRYLELHGVTNPPEIEDVYSVQISSVPEITGAFHCSNELVNRFVENVNWSQLCNFISIPTDCPQRNERMGWAGDTHVFIKTALQNSDSKLFYYRNLQAMEDLQTKEGQYPNIAPVGGGFGGITYESASFIMIWEIYLQCGDKQIIEKHYDALEKYMSYLKKKGMPGDVFVGPLGDWLAQEETDPHLLWNAFYAYDAFLMTKFSRILLREPEAAKYEALEKEIKAYFNETFVEKETGKTKNLDGSICDTQCSYALPLLYHVFEDAHVEVAAAHLNRKVIESGYKVMTGFFGTGALNEVLSTMGYAESAYRLMEQTQFPSWLYSVTQGATTIWERWNSFTTESGFGGNNSMNSFNHYSLGSVKSWLYRHVLGIQPIEEDPGYHSFYLKPQIMHFTHAEGKIDTLYGTISSGFTLEEEQIIYHCEIPGNTKAILILPGMEEKILGSGRYRFAIAKQ